MVFLSSLQVLTVTLHTITFACFMMNWITFCCVAIFLSCQYSVGNSIPLSSKDFYEKYYDLVAPVIQEELDCDDLELIYDYGAEHHVCIVRRSSLLVFCLLDLMHQYSLI